MIAQQVNLKNMYQDFKKSRNGFQTGEFKRVNDAEKLIGQRPFAGTPMLVDSESIECEVDF